MIGFPPSFLFFFVCLFVRFLCFGGVLFGFGVWFCFLFFSFWVFFSFLVIKCGSDIEWLNSTWIFWKTSLQKEEALYSCAEETDSWLCASPSAASNQECGTVLTVVVAFHRIEANVSGEFAWNDLFISWRLCGWCCWLWFADWADLSWNRWGR